MDSIRNRINKILESTSQTLGEFLTTDYDLKDHIEDKNSLPIDDLKVEQWVINNWDERVIATRNLEAPLDPRRHDSDSDDEYDDNEETESIHIISIQVDGPDDHEILVIGWYEDGLHKEFIAKLYPKALGLEGVLNRFAKEA
jgi:hypothetical protein